MAYRKCPCGFYVSGPSAEEADVELRAHECIMTARSELAALKAENERLRGALTKARDSLGEPCSVTYGMAYDCSCYICIALSAIRAALAPPGRKHAADERRRRGAHHTKGEGK